MSYISKILFEKEKIEYHGRVHWIVFAPGIFSLFIAIFLAIQLPMWAESDLFKDMVKSITKNYPIMHGFPEFVSGIIFIHGSYLLIRAFIIATFTELAVTNFRVIAKFGVYNTTTIEIDKFKIAGITVNQTIFGKMFNYGTVDLRGFAGNIEGLPVLAKPYDFQQFISTRTAW